MTEQNQNLAIPTSNKIEEIQETTSVNLGQTSLLDETTLRFFSQMIERANLAIAEKGMSPEESRARVMAKIVGGAAHGFDPISSQTFLHVVNGRLELSASGVAAKIKESGIYDYSIDKLDEDGCQLTARRLVRKADGSEAWEDLSPPVEFTRKMAEEITVREYGKTIKLSEKEVYKNWGTDMFFARCATRLAKRFFPQVLRGSAWGSPTLDYKVPAASTPELPSETSPDKESVTTADSGDPSSEEQPSTVEEVQEQIPFEQAVEEDPDLTDEQREGLEKMIEDDKAEKEKDPDPVETAKMIQGKRIKELDELIIEAGFAPASFVPKYTKKHFDFEAKSLKELTEPQADKLKSSVLDYLAKFDEE